MKLLNDFERGWLSALIDGEGCIWIWKSKQRNKKKGWSWSLGLSIVNTDKNLVYKAKEVCRGIGSIREKKPTGFGKHNLFVYGMCSNGLRWLLPQIKNDLIAKKEKASLIIEALKIIKIGKICSYEDTIRLEKIYRRCGLLRLDKGGYNKFREAE